MRNIGDKCVECGRDTAPGSGLWVNRVPAGRDGKTGYLCSDCQLVECDNCGQKVLDEYLILNEAGFGDLYCLECIDQINGFFALFGLEPIAEDE